MKIMNTELQMIKDNLKSIIKMVELVDYCDRIQYCDHCKKMVSTHRKGAE